MSGLAHQSQVDGLVYDNLYTLTRNPCLQDGRIFGLLAPTNNADLTNTGPQTLAAGLQVTEELLTIAAAANSNTVGLLLPANSLILAVLARVTVAIPTATTFQIGDATTAGRFATGVAVAVNTTAVGILHWSGAVTTLAAGPSQAAAAAIRVTPSATPGNANGRVRLQVVSMVFTAPPV